MEIFTEPNFNKNLSIALGYFDGVHLGHQAVIEQAVHFAQNNNTKSAVITFKDHPYCYFKGVCPKYILTRDDRRKKIENLGVDFLYELNFEDIANMDAQQYLENILLKYFSPTAISTGWNHHFGHDKMGNADFLQKNANTYKYFEIPPKQFEEKIISSSEIRELLSKGEIEQANKMLGYKFSISGKVIEGNKIGRTIGFRTANIEYPKELIVLPFGVYNVSINQYKGIANFGTRPTLKGTTPILEVHILNFDKDIYGENITVEFNKMLRSEKKFDSLEDLKNQIKSDIKNL